jgi:DNA polymerase III subunit delta
MPAFEKHLQEAFPDHLSHAYMVLSPFDFERRRMIEMIASVLHRKDQMEEGTVLDASVCPIENILGHLNSYSLLSSHALVILDRIEKLKKTACEALAGYLAAPSQKVFLILGGSSLKGLTDLYQKGKKELVILDLSEEKPWDRKARLQQWLVKEAAQAQKTLAPALVNHLLEEVGLDMQNLHQELEKLICFSGEKNTIELQDALTICSSNRSVSSWQRAESLVWEEKDISQEAIPDVFSLIGPVRYQLQLGHQLAFFIKERKTLQEIAQFFPHSKSRNLEKNAGIARRRGELFFKEGLSALFDLELSLKNGAHDPSLIWDLFTSKLNLLKHV